MVVRKALERGHPDHGWLESWHTFSFADYQDSTQMGFRALRVINEDFIAAAQGFPTHAHQDMEIVTYVLSGALEHKDSLGTGSTIVPGDVQRMSAGTGVRHSEFNPSPTEQAHILQIWILPKARGQAPSYEQKHFLKADKSGQLVLIGSQDGREGSVVIGQDVSLFASILAPDQRVEASISPGRHAWLHVARGKLVANGFDLATGDALGVSDERSIAITAASEEAEFLVFDLA